MVRQIAATTTQRTSETTSRFKTEEIDQKQTVWGAYKVAIGTVHGLKEFVCKPILTTLNWVKVVNGSLPAPAEATFKIFSIIKNGSEITSVPGIGEKVVKSLAKPDLREVVKEVVGSVHVFYDLTGMLVSQGVLVISKVAMEYFKTTNFAAVFLIQSSFARNEYNVIYTEGKTTEQVNLASLKLAKAVSYVALGALGLVGFAFSVALPSWAMLACSTSALVFSVTAFFYDKVVEPNKEGSETPSLTKKATPSKKPVVPVKTTNKKAAPAKKAAQPQKTKKARH